MNLFLKKIIPITLVVLMMPSLVFGQQSGNNSNDKTLNQNTRTVNNQIRTDLDYTGNNTNSNVDVTGAPRAIVVDPNTGQTYLPAQLQNSQALGITGNAQYGIQGSVAAQAFSICIEASGLTGIVKDTIGKLTAGVLDPLRVPVGNSVQEGKDTGSLITGGISWDQMGWCIANGLLEAIGDATVAWINSGFQGNPVFVDDPGQFFADVADIQAGIFLNDVSNGLLCTPIQNWVRINLANNYNNQIGGYAPQCTFSDNALTQFMNGETFSWTDWLNYTQNPYNNPFGATIYSQIELDQRISAMLDLQQTKLQWGAGFLSKQDPETGKITTPGIVIQEQINQRLFSGQSRLEIADEFDEVVSALLDQLIKIAITETLEQAN